MRWITYIREHGICVWCKKEKTLTKSINDGQFKFCEECNASSRAMVKAIEKAVVEATTGKCKNCWMNHLLVKDPKGIWHHRKEVGNILGKSICGAKDARFSKSYCGCMNPELLIQREPVAQREEEYI